MGSCSKDFYDEIKLSNNSKQMRYLNKNEVLSIPKIVIKLNEFRNVENRSTDRVDQSNVYNFYVNTQSALSYYGTILSALTNSSGGSMSLTNITFSGSPPAGFKNNLSVTKFYDPGDTGSGTTTNLNQDYPIQIEPQAIGDRLHYTIKSSYSTVMTYTGVMTLHIEFTKKSYLIDIPIVHNIT